MAGSAKLTLGPLLFNWPAETVRDFYFRVADEAPVDVVYLGEVVCAKRASLLAAPLAEAAARLARAGKEVVLSSLALTMSEAELDSARALCAEAEGLVEANDMACVSLLAGRPHIVGPYINLYNEDSLRVFADNGAVRVVLPFELPASAVATLAATGAAALEIQVFGRQPLAISARCYHARHHGLHRDGCQYVCGEDTDGLDLATLDGTPFLAVNGTQTLSFRYVNLVHQLAALRAMGVDNFRLSPHAIDMVAVARIFRDVLDDREVPAAGAAALNRLVPAAEFCNGFYHDRVGADWVDINGASPLA
ncbi:MAG: ubiquinone anaerobic biosynthesis protein UbiV [Alphaproteobacteria bacterium]